jgi:hypothetical protein
MTGIAAIPGKFRRGPVWTLPVKQIMLQAGFDPGENRSDTPLLERDIQ